jgi:hypothetical protein
MGNMHAANMRVFMIKALFLASGAVVLLTGLAAPAQAYTCSQHYTSCVKTYNNPPAVCSCARSICLKSVGPTGDAGDKWNYIPGINACFKR